MLNAKVVLDTVKSNSLFPETSPRDLTISDLQRNHTMENISLKPEKNYETEDLSKT